MAIYEFYLMKTIAPQDLHDRRQKGEAVRLLDVRTPVEHAQIHVPGVELVPLDKLDPAGLAARGFSKDEPIYVLCRTGGRATQAAAKLEKEGFTRCQVVEGGTQAWADAGLPVNRGAAKCISLERQVRIAAGSLALSGALLAHFVNPNFIWLSAFIGAGLVFAGITDWCGMGLLIAKMPWNRA